MRIVASHFRREEGRGVLIVEVKKDRVSASAALSNEGTKPLGPEQLRIEADFNGLLSTDDSLSVTYSGTPAQPRELGFARARYAKRINSTGTEVALTATASAAKPGAYLREMDLSSRSWSISASVLQPLWRRRNASLWLEGGFGLSNLVQRSQGELSRHDRIAAARITLYGYADLAGGRLRSSFTINKGFDILGATQPGDPLASRFDGDGTFTSYYVWADWTRNLGGGLSLRLAGQGQLASEPLLVTEETSLGGTAFLRGYDWSERSGDKGVMGMVELRYDWQQSLDHLPRAQFYAFLDGGTVGNINSSFGSGSLASTGGGVRASVSESIGASLEVAVPLSGPRYDTGDETPKVNLRVVKSF